MEVKIKDGNGYVEADWTIENGVMVVSPKVEKFEPKDGDVVFLSGPWDYVFVYKDALTVEAYYYVAISLDDLALHLPDGSHIGYIDTLRPATEEEKQKLFDKLAEEGHEWDAEKKELLKLKWKPIVGERFYYPANQDHFFKTYHHAHSTQESLELDKDIKRGWCFKTREECQEFCDRLNKAINSVKP